MDGSEGRNTFIAIADRPGHQHQRDHMCGGVVRSRNRASDRVMPDD
jgi:hypothetical protein